MKKIVKNIMILILPVVFVAGLIIFVDPYFHFHKPIVGISYFIDDERYQNDGILRHFEYDTILTGTSLDQNEKVSEAEALFGGKAVKVPFAGAYLPEQSATLDRALKRKPVKRVIMSLGYSGFTEAEYDYWGNEGYVYPDFMYDENIFNDVKYIFNITTLGYTLRNIVNTVRGIESTNFDEYSNWQSYHTFGKKALFASYNRSPKTDKAELIKKETVKKNIKENLVYLAKKYTDTEFNFYFPPYSIIFWDAVNQNGLMDNKIDGLKTVVEELLPYENVKMSYFVNDIDIITNHNNYKDAVHYSEEINSYILKKIKSLEKVLTKENYKKILKTTRDYYKSFNYDSLFE